MAAVSGVIRLATRASVLARCQTALVAAALTRLGAVVEVVAVSTRGDEITDRPLADVGGKALFIKGLQEAIAEGRADAAVHSLKDMEAQPTPGFALAAVGFAADCRDVVVCGGAADGAVGGGLDQLPAGARVGTCSPRRAALLAQHYPRLCVVPMRGNLQTRFAKLDAGDADALLLAAAGLERLGLLGRAACFLPPTRFIPAVGQGLIGVECAADNAALLAFLAGVDDARARARAEAERAFARAMQGDCHTALGAYATVGDGGGVRLHAFYAGGGAYHEATAAVADVVAAAEAGAAAAAVIKRDCA